MVEAAGSPPNDGRTFDGVVCNAGIGLGRGLANTSVEDWDATFAVNLRGPFLIAKHAVEVLPEGRSIVFIGSLAGLQPGSRCPRTTPRRRD